MSLISIGASALLVAIPNQSTHIPSNFGILTTQLDHILGTSLDMKIIASTFEIAQITEKKVLSEIDRLNTILGSYLLESEFNRWANTINVEVRLSKELFSVLSQFDYWHQKTEGIINAASAHIAKVWQESSDQNQSPTKSNLFQAVNEANVSHWNLNEQSQSGKRTSEFTIQLHSFAKSFVLNQVANVAMGVKGVQAIVLNSGGDLVVRGDWSEKIMIADPFNSADNGQFLQVLQVENKAVATSGNYKRGFEIAENHYSHVIDPRTGLPAEHIVSATVVHPDPVTAGALSTAFNVMSLGQIENFSKNDPNLEYHVVTKKGLQMTSLNWSGSPVVMNDKANNNTSISYVNLKEKLWSANQELVINLELAKFEGRFRRPFVAVWIEDENHKLIRRIAVWYNKSRWLPELRYWYDAQRKSELDLNSIASATRSAGNYSLVWDGKNDAGQFVNQGKYTVFIEAAREHGSYQLMKQEMNFNGKVRDQSLSGNEEITSASLAYRDK